MGTSQFSSGPVEAVVSNIKFESLLHNIDSQYFFLKKKKGSWTDDLVKETIKMLTWSHNIWMVHSSEQQYETLGMRRRQCVLRGRFL